MKTKINNTIKKYGMLSSDDYIAVAFSGGADSTALLDILYKEGKKVCAVHVNHMIRGEEADRDEDFCRDFCTKRNIPFFCHRVNVPLYAEKSGEGMEEAARRLRYAAIEETAATEGITKVATAHHADDNAETVIFNIVRGSGAKGGCGIPPVRGIYIRPLLEVTRDEIIAYCDGNGISYVTDSTNLSVDYTRNYIRHEIMPRLKKVNPSATEALGRFSSFLREDNDALEDMVPNSADRQTLAELPDALLSRYIRGKCEVASHKTVASLIAAIRRGNEYIVTDIGRDTVAVCDRNSVIFRKKITQPTHIDSILSMGISDFSEFGRFFVTADSDKIEELRNIYKISISTLLNSDRIKGDLHIRSRRDGDRYRYNGMTHTLKKLFNTRKIPVEQRGNVPLVCDDEGILWIPGFPTADRVKSNRKEKNTIFIGYIKGEDDDT